MRTSLWTPLSSTFAFAVALAIAVPATAADLPEACSSHTAAVTGGPLPPSDSETVVIRWLGNANYEFAYKGKVYLFDAYFDRTPRSHKIGFTAADVKKAEAIFVSHAHFDHISDIGPVSRQTGAPVIGAPLTAEIAKKLGTPEKQIVVARGGETMKFGDASRDRVGATFHHPARPHRYLREPLSKRLAAVFGRGKEEARRCKVPRHLRSKGDHGRYASLCADIPLGLQGRADR